MKRSVLQDYLPLLQSALGETHQVRESSNQGSGEDERLLIFEGEGLPVATLSWVQDSPLTLEFRIASLITNIPGQLVTTHHSLVESSLTDISRRFRQQLYQERNLSERQ